MFLGESNAETHLIHPTALFEFLRYHAKKLHKTHKKADENAKKRAKNA